MAGRIRTTFQNEIFLTKEEVAEQMSDFLRHLEPDAEILAEKIVEVPDDGEAGDTKIVERKTWCARWREFLVVAIDANGVQASISLRL